MIFPSIKHRFQRFQNRIQSGCILLCYHRVGKDLKDRWGNAVSVENFRDHIDFIRATYRPVSLGDLSRFVKLGKLPSKRCVAVTFDDGYDVNREYAGNILSDGEVPAIFYVNTYTIDTGRYFWWDELQKLWQNRNILPDRIKISCMGADLDLEIGGDIQFEHTLSILRGLLKGLKPVARLSLIDKLLDQLNVKSELIQEYKPLAKTGIKEISDHRLFSIGAHTHSHCSLGLMGPEAQRDELVQNKEILESITGKSVTHFSYPFGGEVDFDGTTVGIVKELGFKSAVTTIKKPFRNSGDIFQIPRVSVKNWDAATFRSKMEQLWSQ